MKRILRVLLTAGLLVVSASVAADAHVVYEGPVSVWDAADGKCLMNYSETSHGTGGGYAKASLDAYRNFSSYVDCFQPWDRGPGYLREAATVYRWNKNAQEWRQCFSLGWSYNPTTASKFSIHDQFDAPCGAGYYQTLSWAQVKYNGNWKPNDMGPIWSGSHQLPI